MIVIVSSAVDSSSEATISAYSRIVSIPDSEGVERVVVSARLSAVPGGALRIVTRVVP